MGSQPVTIAEKLLSSAARLSGPERSPFTAEDLVVQAWQDFPDTFGLQGYADEYPDSNRVLTNIMGDKGLAGGGQVERISEKTYRLTTAGVAAAAALDEGIETELRAALDRERTRQIVRLAETRAVGKLERGRRASITERDALKFLGVTARSDGKKVRAQMANIEDALRCALDAVKRGGEAPLSVQHGRQSLGVTELQNISACYHYIREAYSDEISVLLSR